MLRIHFTSDDRARVSVSGGFQQLWEIALSLHVLQKPQGGPIFAPWRDRVAARLRNPQLAAKVSFLHTINPCGPYFPDFLTPVLDGAPELETAIDSVLSVPAGQIHQELTTLSTHRRLPSSIRPLAAGERQGMAWLGTSLRDYYHAAIKPFEDQIQSDVDKERARLAAALLDRGVEGLFATLRPFFRWDSPVLEVPYPRDREIHLNGRGLLLVPSFFCRRTPVTYADADMKPVIVYPIERTTGSHGAVAGECSEPNLGALHALMGSTRTRVLDALTCVMTSRELGKRISLSEASVSEHTSVLRKAGLIVSQRRGNCLLHMRTSLGAELLARTGGVDTAPARPRPAVRHP